MSEFSHVDARGKAKMVDVGSKDLTKRRCTASGVVHMSESTVAKIAENELAKGDVLTVAKIAGISAAKACSTLIPLCHPLSLTNVEIAFDLGKDFVSIRAIAETVGQTGVEMEALVAVSVAGLTIYDMCKAVDKQMVIGEICVQEKLGGKSDWQRTHA